MVTAPALPIYGHMCAVLPNQNLITSFKDFYFVFGAKVIYFLWRIRIHKNLGRARTSARAACAESFKNLKKSPKFRNFAIVQTRAARAEVRARQKFFRIRILHEK